MREEEKGEGGGGTRPPMASRAWDTELEQLQKDGVFQSVC